jgi:hypothetical protein
MKTSNHRPLGARYGRNLGRREVDETDCEVIQAYLPHHLQNFSILAKLPHLLAEVVDGLVKQLAKILGLFVGFATLLRFLFHNPTFLLILAFIFEVLPSRRCSSHFETTMTV